MTYRIIYCQEYQRIITSCIIDARKGTLLANKRGAVIKAEIDIQIALIAPNVLVYKIETEKGNMGGYFSITVNEENKTGTLQQKVLRNSFESKQLEISQLISNFIFGGEWKRDFLFSN